MASPAVIYFATNRLPIGNPVTGFADELSSVDGLNIRFGRATFDPATRAVGLDVAAEQLHGSETRSEPLLGSRQILDEILRLPPGDIVFLVHGFANTFESSLEGAAEISKGLGRTVFLFAWASAGSLGAYPLDRDRAIPSGQALGRVFRIFLGWLRRLREDGHDCRRPIHLVAHSMGNYVLRHAVQALVASLNGGQIPLVLDQVILAAADEDADAFERVDKLLPLASAARAISVYHTETDGGLTVSDQYKGNPLRLGHRGPANMNIIRDNIFAIDVTATVSKTEGLPDNDPINHWFIRRTPSVVADANAVLAHTDQFEIGNRTEVAGTLRRFALLKAKARRGRNR
jgi:esterase/lipase superfamily enzyme